MTKYFIPDFDIIGTKMFKSLKVEDDEQVLRCNECNCVFTTSPCGEINLVIGEDLSLTPVCPECGLGHPRIDLRHLR